MERRCGKKVIFFSEGRTSESTAKFFCIGRDIEYRELTLERNAENVWELVSDSRTQPELLGGRIVILLSELMRDRTEFIGTPTELSAQIDPVGSEGITPKKVSRLILQSVAALSKIGISAVVRRSNGKRLIELRRAESDDAQGTQAVDPIDPAAVSGGEKRPVFRPVSRCVRGWGLGWRVYPARGYSARTGRAPRRHKNGEYAAVTRGRPAFQRHEAHVEGSDTPTQECQNSAV